MNRTYLFSLAGLLLIGLPLSAQVTQPACTPATLTGVRALTLTGRGLNSSLAITKTFQTVGVATFDGVSAVTFTLNVNTNVSQGVAQTWTGAYTLTAACTGTLTTSTGDGARFTLIVYNSGNGFTITGQDGTYALSGSGSPAPASCITGSLSGPYVFSGNGFAFTGSAVAGVNAISGLLQFDGRSGITGNWSVTTNGTATPAIVSGIYTVSAACLASATLTDSSGIAYTMNFTVTAANNADFSVNIAGPTTSFSASGHSTATYPGLSLTSAAEGTASSTPPGSIFALYGTGLVASGSTQANSLPLPTTLLSTTVTVNGEAAPLFYVSSTQINAQMPWDIQSGLATVVVSNGTPPVMSNTVAVTVPSAATPEMFVYNSNRAVVQNPDFTVNSSTSPSHIGNVVVGYFTGGGPVTAAAPLVSGRGAPGNGLSPVTGTPVVVTVGGIPATVIFTGLTPTEVGLYQVNFIVPQVATGDRTMTISIGGIVSAGAVMTVAN